jgi:predicted Zn-dependent protease
MKRRTFLISAAAMMPAARIGFSQIPEDDVILRAMRDELDRSRQLRVVGGGDAVPYFLSYSLSDATSFHVAASFGAALAVSRNRFRVPEIEVRVGNYDFDNTGHIYSGIYTGSKFDGGWPLDDSYATLRECFWLGTDRAYKTAIESMSRKRAALNNASVPAEKLADYSQAETVKYIAKAVRGKLDDAAWQARVVKLSAIFNSYPEVLSAGVEFQAIQGVTYLMNSEGTTLRYPDDVLFLYTKVEGHAPDGMVVRDFAGFQAIDPEKMASESEMRKGFTDAAENVRALAKAPAGEACSGPTLFEPAAAAQLFAQLLGDNLWMPRKPLAEPGRSVNFLPSELESKLGSRILPEWIDVVDDPTQTAWNGKTLVGHELYDMEGVPQQAVSVVEKGVLKNFLTTRQPIRGSSKSNGHARLPGSYGADRAAITNLIVKSSQASPLADLKKKMIDMCKERGKPYGMLVRKLDYPFSASASDLRSLASGSTQSGGSARPLSPPVLVYRVYADGREELVRGLRFRGVSSRALRDVLAASQESALFDFVDNAAPLAFLGAGGFLAPTAVVAPGLLFDEMEFESPQDQLAKPPIVPPPTA